LNLGVITPEFFAMQVLVALATTAMTSPMLMALGISRPKQ
jgi:hypothetical protein